MKDQSYSEVTATVELLSRYLSAEDAERFRRDEAFRERIGRCVQNNGLPPGRHHIELRSNLRGNVFGIDEWLGLLRLGFNPTMQKSVEEAPFFLTLADKCPLHPGMKLRDTHFAYLTKPTLQKRRATLGEWDWFIRNSLNHLLDTNFSEISENEPVMTQETCRSAWYLACIEDEPQNIDTQPTPLELLGRIPAGYEAPLAIEAFQGLLARALLKGVSSPTIFLTQSRAADGKICALYLRAYQQEPTRLSTGVTFLDPDKPMYKFTEVGIFAVKREIPVPDWAKQRGIK